MKKFIGFLFIALMAFALNSCEFETTQTKSDSGISKASVQVMTNQKGHTSEQENIMEKYKRDNEPGAIKHLYIISDASGQVLIYSTVRGKVTSSGKRLTPNTVLGNGYQSSGEDNIVNIGNKTFVSDEVIQDDGTYGSSIEYLYWFDTKGVYHQHYKSQGEMIHISDQPLAIKSVVINLDISTGK